MAPSAQIAGGRRVRRWTREAIIAKILEWNDRYGEPPCSADWNPSLARWRAQEWRLDRYRDGRWPSTSAVKRPFGGSFDAAIRAAGLEPHRSGPRRRAALAAAPGVPQRAPAPPRAITDELLEANARATRAEARAAALERGLAAAERRAERAEDVVGDARRRARRAAEQAGRARRSRERTRATARDRSTEALERLELVSADADARVRAAEDQVEAALRDATDARRAARAAETRAADAETRAATAERLADVARADAAAARRAGNAGDADDGAWAAARAAEARAGALERRLRELATIAVGEPRRLTAEEIAALRARGPSGPAVLAAALRRLARARAAGDRAGLDAALADVASAAVRWRDAL